MRKSQTPGGGGGAGIGIDLDAELLGDGNGGANGQALFDALGADGAA